jgi:hypothetical protein
VLGPGCPLQVDHHPDQIQVVYQPWGLFLFKQSRSLSGCIRFGSRSQNKDEISIVVSDLRTYFFMSFDHCSQFTLLSGSIVRFPAPCLPRPVLDKVRKDKPMDYSFLLTKREKGVIRTLNKEYQKRWGMAPTTDRDLVYYLGDNAVRRCWSACSGKLPTLRMAGGLLWSPQRKRFMTEREKLGSLGFPVTGRIARNMKVSELPLSDVKRCSQIAGNCMHFTTIGIVQLVALVSFRFSAVQESECQ